MTITVYFGLRDTKLGPERRWFKVRTQRKSTEEIAICASESENELFPSRLLETPRAKPEGFQSVEMGTSKFSSMGTRYFSAWNEASSCLSSAFFFEVEIFFYFKNKKTPKDANWLRFLGRRLRKSHKRTGDTQNTSWTSPCTCSFKLDVVEWIWAELCLHVYVFLLSSQTPTNPTFSLSRVLCELC